jgi:predicted amidohydrolase YtcJ
VIRKRIALLNGNIYPGNGMPDCQALLISGDRVATLGTDDEIESMIGPDTVRLNLGGRRVIPGFVDSHNHVLSGATLLTGVNCFGMTSIDQLKEAVARKAAEVGPGEWITGAGWIESQFQEGRAPNRKDLDEAAPKNPVMLTRLFASVAVNSLALEKAGIGRGFVPVAGRVDLDESGEPTGILREAAQGLVRRAVKRQGPAGDTEDLVKLALNEYLRYGVTSLLDPGVDSNLMHAYTSLWAKGELPLRVTAMPAWHGISVISGDSSILPAIEVGLQPGLGDEWFRVGNLKMAIDGGLGSKTALMHGPFRDFTRSTVPLRLDLNRLGAYVREANDAGWGVGIHCCGDLAQDLAVSHMVDAFGIRKPLSHQRHHIIHGYYPTEYALRAMSAHDIAVSAQPGFTYVEGDIYPSVIGEEALSGFKPLRTYLDRGIRVAINSDVASGPYDPFVVLYGAVARKTLKGLDFGQAEALTPREAVDCFSYGGAYLAYRDVECGTLAPGKLADLAILDRDILNGSSEDILRCRVEATVLGGELVYVREGVSFDKPFCLI